MVVCDIYKLFRNGKSFTKEGRKLDRSGIAIPRAYCEDKNRDWSDNGLWHEIDEEKTAEFYVLREKERLIKIKNSKISKEVAKNLANMLDVGIEDYQDIDVVDEEEVVTDPKIKKLTKKEKMRGIGDLKVAYLEKFGKHVPVNKKNDIDWIREKVNQEETNETNV